MINKRFLSDFVLILFDAFIILFCIIAVFGLIYGVQPCMVSGLSMAPTLDDGDLLISVPAKNNSLKDGDIIIIDVKDTYIDSDYIIKRYYKNDDNTFNCYGDNEKVSFDSRFFGELDNDRIKWKCILNLNKGTFY